MSPRQARRERRAAERKVKKAELKRNRQLAMAARGDEAALFSEPKIQNGDVERKAKKAELKRAKAAAAGAASIEIGFVSQNDPHTGSAEAPVQIGFVSQSSTKRAEINRANSLHSTGPRSEQGKSASSRNSLKHGLASGTLVVAGEDGAAFEALKNSLFEEHQPATDTETLLVTEMAQSWWLTQRALRLQNECFTETGIDEKRLALFLRYQTTHERAFHKALSTLIRLKKARFKAEGGFVSQKPARVTSESGFVSQNGPRTAPESGFVSQNPDEFPGFASAAAKKDAA